MKKRTVIYMLRKRRERFICNILTEEIRMAIDKEIINKMIATASTL